MSSLTEQQQQTLLAVAREAIAAGLHDRREPSPDPGAYPDTLRRVLATFVTLQIGARLRGCIGTLEAIEPLVIDVAKHAYAAAFTDPRFPPVTGEELPQLDIQVSILSPRRPITFTGEADLVRQLRPGVDGLIITQGARRATFLPSVWQSIPDRATFLAQLKLKAGLPDGANGFLAWRYTTETVPAADPHAPMGAP
jgi:AmmeMemoRadiSam system protein A